MNRTTLARRYGPLVAALAVQLVIIVTAPSTTPRSASVAAGATGGASASGEGATAGEAGGGTNNGLTPGPGTGVPGGTATVTAGGGTGAASVGGGVGGGGGSAVPPGVVAGDTTHCVKGRNFDPGIAYWAPPCLPGKPGGPYPNNGGATSMGVTTDTVTIVNYVTNYGAEVNAILAAQGILRTYAEAKVWDAAMQTFINKYYMLYGRQVKIITYQGQCQSVPPNYQCLIPEMDRVVDTFHPYFVYWNNPVCSACFAELARKKTIAFGGEGLSDELTNANAPYMYSAVMSATRMEKAFAEWWCGQMSSVNVPTRRVRYAPGTNPSQNFAGEPRRLGIISTNDPDNKDTVVKVLGPELKRLCGDKIWHTYFYDQNINTAAQQVAAGIAAMNTPQNPANVVLCLCDTVAPAFVYQGESNNNYWPENIVASVQQMDQDTTAQAYGAGANGQPSLACPLPARGCEFDNAFGLGSLSPLEPEGDNVGLRMFRAGGGKDCPYASAAECAYQARFYGMMANLIQNTGPNLTPANTAARAPLMPPVGGGTTGQALLALGKNNWNWIQDTRIVYWDKHKPSPYNKQPGSYVQLGDRLNLGQFPSAPAGPAMPFPRR